MIVIGLGLKQTTKYLNQILTIIMNLFLNHRRKSICLNYRIKFVIYFYDRNSIAIKSDNCE